MGYTQDYMQYMSGTECPDSFLLWTSLSLAGAFCGHRVWIKHGDYFDIYPNLYVNLVGLPGSGKSVARDKVAEIMHNLWPEYPTSADIQSHQHICRVMASPQGAFTWTNGSGECSLYRPFFATPDELQNFLATDKTGMMGFLVGVHSSKGFATGFKIEGDLPQYIENPYFSLLTCATPEWFMSNLRIDLFSGGAGRRFIIVYDRKAKRKPFPKYVDGSVEAFARVIDHLKCLREYHGCSVMDPAAYPWWEKWYMSKDEWSHRDDPIVAQFHETKHIMVLKVALLLSLNERPFSRMVTEEHLRAALGMIDLLEPGVIRLTSGIGRNPLAGAGAELIEKLSLCGGMQTEKKFRIQFYRNLRDMEWEEMVGHFTSTGELIRLSAEDENGVVRGLLFLPDTYKTTLKHVCSKCNRRYYKPTVCCGTPTAVSTAPCSVPVTTANSTPPAA